MGCLIPESAMNSDTLQAGKRNTLEASGGKPSDSYMRRSWRAFARQRLNWLPVLVIVVGLLMAAIPTEWLPMDPTLVKVGDRLQPPSWSICPGSHPLGTDTLGRDVFSRIIFAARWTYFVTVAGVFISAIFGTLTGLVAGFFGGTKLDAVLSRLMDIQLAFPYILLALSVLAVAGPGLLNMILVLGLVDWAHYARVVRGCALSVRQHSFIEAAFSVGATNSRIIFYHILPNVISPILVMTTFSAARLMLTESALSFLGLGVPPPATTWGGMLGSGRDYMYRAWWMTALPGLLITLTIVAINMLGDSLRDAVDPQAKAN